MFIKYQTVRNTVIGITTTVVGGVAAFFGLQSDNEPPALPARQVSVQDVAPPLTADGPVESAVEIGPAGTMPYRRPTAASGNTSKPMAPPDRATLSNHDRYVAAMKFATSRADPSGKGKDVLGTTSPWKLNLYDDNQDGQWDRAKLDYDRDEADDEKWNFKHGRWEKDGGASIWNGERWVRSANESPAVTQQPQPSADDTLARYRKAMQIATSRAAASGKGKDVLGPSSPWKLNLYDDDKDGQWDRGKLDYDRDEVDDEKWNFKNGRWEKDGGASVWHGNNWNQNSGRSSAVTKQIKPATSALARYRKAMQIATSPAAASGKGKDVLGPSSPWKLNLYDDDKDGQWDRGKLDYDRDEVDDEKWNFKNGRWEKDGGATIWNGRAWEPSK